MVARFTVGTEENCLNIAFTLFHLASADDDLRHFVTVPCAFPKANSLGFHLVTAAILYRFKIQSKYNSYFPSKVGISSIREPFV